MRVLVDCRPAFGGIQRVVERLASGLATGDASPTIIAWRAAPGTPVPPDERLPPVRRWLRPGLGLIRRTLLEQVGLAVAARRSGATLAHSPHGVTPARRPVPWIASVWDLSPVDPRFAHPSPLLQRYRRWCFHLTLRHAAHLVVPSNAIRDLLVAELNVPPGRMTTISPIAGLAATAAHRRHQPSRPTHLLHVGTLEPRKNIGELLEGYARLDPSSRPPLRLVGRRGWRDGAILRQIEAAAGDVRWLGEVDDATLDVLYRDAVAVVQLSHHEGFDLPVLEALARGVPVVASDIPTHREVAGAHALYAGPGDSREVAAAIREVLGWAPARRRTWGDGARDRAAGLESRDIISEHLAVYRRVARASHHPRP